MKYYKTSRFPHIIGSTGFIALLACALIAIGAAVWFAVSNRTAPEQTPADDNRGSQNPSYEDTTPSYDEPTQSYDNNTNGNDHMLGPNASTSIAGNVSSVPYESEKNTSEEPKPEPQPEPEKRSFILPAEGNISKDYSDTALQYSATYGDMRLHTGIDIACEKGSDIKAASSGTVTAVEESASLGKTVIIDHGDGITVKYCGFDSISAKQGDKVSCGDLLGVSGSIPSECADQSHIHIEVIKDSKQVSPLEALGLQ